MKKIIITLAAVLALLSSSMLVSCTGNSMTDANTNGGSTSGAPSTSTTEKETNILDEAESRLEDMSEDATHGVEDSNGGTSSRGMMPRGK